MKRKSSIVLMLISTIFALGSACNVSPSEGSTCNALVVEDECTGGTTCQTIGSCTATYCCPADPTTSSDPHCNGYLCPPLPPDGGDDLSDAGVDADADGGADGS